MAWEDDEQREIEEMELRERAEQRYRQDQQYQSGYLDHVYQMGRKAGYGPEQMDDIVELMVDKFNQKITGNPKADSEANFNYAMSEYERKDAPEHRRALVDYIARTDKKDKRAVERWARKVTERGEDY